MGQSIHIVYDQNQPSQSCYCDPNVFYKRSQLWRNFIAGLFISSGVVLAVAILIWRRMQRANGR